MDDSHYNDIFKLLFKRKTFQNDTVRKQNISFVFSRVTHPMLRVEQLYDIMCNAYSDQSIARDRTFEILLTEDLMK